MIIQLDGRNAIFTFRNEKGELSSVNLADFSGKINFRTLIRAYLKEEDIFVNTRSVKYGPSLFLALTKRPITAIDVLKIALKLQGGENN